MSEIIRPEQFGRCENEEKKMLEKKKRRQGWKCDRSLFPVTKERKKSSQKRMTGVPEPDTKVVPASFQAIVFTQPLCPSRLASLNVHEKGIRKLPFFGGKTL